MAAKTNNRGEIRTFLKNECSPEMAKKIEKNRLVIMGRAKYEAQKEGEE
jgi:hypothetical protein